LAYSSSLKIEAIYSPEASAFLQTVQRYNPDERTLQTKGAREQSLRRIFKPKKGIKRSAEEITEELNNLYSSSNIIRKAVSIGI
jgi:hypothetical protein